jgi:hypothetical protein
MGFAASTYEEFAVSFCKLSMFFSISTKLRQNRAMTCQPMAFHRHSRWRRTSLKIVAHFRFYFRRLSMFFLVRIPKFTKIGCWGAGLQRFIDFQDGCSSNFWNWLHFSGCVVFWTPNVLLSMCTEIYQNQAINGRLTAFYWFSRWRWRPSLNFGRTLPVLCFLGSEHSSWSVYQFHRCLAVNGRFTQCHSCWQPMLAELGVKRSFWG